MNLRDKLKMFLAGNRYTLENVSGVPPLSLPDALQKELAAVIALGGTQQASTPTPTTPVDIVSNNGVLKVSPNLFDGAFELGTYKLDTGAPASHTDRVRCVNAIEISASTSYTVSSPDTSVLATAMRWLFYDSTDTFISSIEGGATVTSPANAKYLRFWIGTRYHVDNAPRVQIEEGSTATPYYAYNTVWADGLQETIGITTRNLADMSRENVVVGKYIGSDGVVSTNNKNFYNSKYIPVTSGATYTWSASQNISFFNIMEYDASKTFIQRTQSTGYSSRSITLQSNTKYILFGANIDASTVLTYDFINAIQWQIEAGSMATNYIPCNSSEATTEILLKVATYKDGQEVVSGVIQRNVGTVVLNGSENWRKENNRYVYEDGTTDRLASVVGGFCNYFEVKTFSLNETNPCIMWTTSGFHVISTEATVEDFKQWLSTHKLIIVYAKNLPLVEQVSGQPMSTIYGDNTAVITQAGMSGLELGVTYYKRA